jgi:hypothetical protein
MNPRGKAVKTKYPKECEQFTYFPPCLFCYVRLRARSLFYIDYMLVRPYRKNCLLKHIIEGNVEGVIEMTGRQGRRRKQLLDDKNDRVLQKESHRTVRRTRFGRIYGPVAR